MSRLDDQVNAVWDVVRLYLDDGVAKAGEQDIKDDIRIALTPPSLDSYGLVRGQEVKYMPAPGKRLKPGRVTGINLDGSVIIHDEGRSFARSIPVEHIHKQEIGPRGGTTWVPVKG